MWWNFHRIRFATSYLRCRFNGTWERSSELNRLYSQRDWSAFETKIQALEPEDGIRLVWQTMQLDFLQSLEAPIDQWKALAQKLTKRGHFLSYLAFQNYLTALVYAGDLAGFKCAYQRGRKIYHAAVPVNALGAACALFLRHRDVQGCLDFIRDGAPSGKGMPRALWELKSVPYRWSAEQSLTSIARMQLRDAFAEVFDVVVQPASPAAKVYGASMNCWEVLERKEPNLWREMRFMPDQQEAFRNRVQEALESRQPFMFLRLGDGEAYAFDEGGSGELSGFHDQLERLWWGVELGEKWRMRMQSESILTMRQADAIGFPYVSRLAQVLHEFESGEMSMASKKLSTLFNGVKALGESGKLIAETWVDEYANFCFAHPRHLKTLIDGAQKVVVVGCFEIPKGHVLDDSKVEFLAIPPVQKVARAKGLALPQGHLPELIPTLEEALRRNMGPGSLLLLSAGFAGKPLLRIAKEQGAVALDFGSALDHVLGYQTRSAELYHLFGDPIPVSNGK